MVPSLVSDGSTLAKAKRTLLTAVSRREGTQAILRAVADVEALGAVTETVEGRWSLIYSTNQAGPIDTAAPGLSQAVIDKTYATLFKNVPALAGAQTDNKAAVSNIQTLDLTSGLLTNRVRSTAAAPLSDVLVVCPALAGVGVSLSQIHAGNS